jgi:hypothetical protein
MSNKSTNGAGERTPLINGGPAPSGHDDGYDHHHSSGFFGSLFNSKYTPGIDSENRVVRSLAYVLHVTKVTLLSSKPIPSIVLSIRNIAVMPTIV